MVEAGLMMDSKTSQEQALAAAIQEKRYGSGFSRDLGVSEDKVAEQLERLNLTEEESSALILEDENEDDLVNLEWAFIAKVLSPSVLHIQTIMAALRPAWGIPRGMIPKSVGDNIFIVEFASKEDKDRVVAGAPWTVGKHAVLLRNFDAKLRPSEVRFDKLTLWARIKNPRFELMNKYWGESLGSKLGKVEKVDVDTDGRSWGDHLRVRVTVDITRPMMRVITTYSLKHKKYESYEVRYERLPHYCFSCGLVGNSSLDCPTPGKRNEKGKLPWDAEYVCVREEKKNGFSKSGQSSLSNGRSSFDNKRAEAQFPANSRSKDMNVDCTEMQQEGTLL